MLPKPIAVAFIPLLFSGCGGEGDLGPAPVPENYAEEIQTWVDARINDLTQPTGYMRLAGMYWFDDDGEYSFGSGNDVDFQFPEGTIPEYAGVFTFRDGNVVMTAADDVRITQDEEPVQEVTLYDGDETPAIEHGPLEWVVVERGDLTGIRLYNKNNPEADQFSGFDMYPVDPAWRLKARFIPAPDSAAIPIANVLGQLEEYPSPGRLEFTINGELFSLDALQGTTRLFIIVADETNQTETYQAGRYMYIDYPEEGSEFTVIDFNKAYNPPCAYSKFTTCQLPPPQNRLNVAITAGEKRPVGWDGLES